MPLNQLNWLQSEMVTVAMYAMKMWSVRDAFLHRCTRHCMVPNKKTLWGN